MILTLYAILIFTTVYQLYFLQASFRNCLKNYPEIVTMTKPLVPSGLGAEKLSFQLFVLKLSSDIVELDSTAKRYWFS